MVADCAGVLFTRLGFGWWGPVLGLVGAGRTELLRLVYGLEKPDTGCLRDLQPCGDFAGIPISDAARLRAEAWDASIQSLPEWQCRPHSADYIWRGPSQLRISKEVDPISREIVAFHAEWLRSVDRAVYLDGRPHPVAHDLRAPIRALDGYAQLVLAESGAQLSSHSRDALTRISTDNAYTAAD